MRAFDLHVTTTLHGRHADVTVPCDTEALGHGLVELSDRAFERYAEWLGVGTPSGRCSVELLLPVEYERESVRDRSLHDSTAGFTRPGARAPSSAGARQAWAPMTLLATTILRFPGIAQPTLQ